MTDYIMGKERHYYVTAILGLEPSHYCYVPFGKKILLLNEQSPTGAYIFYRPAEHREIVGVKVSEGSHQRHLRIHDVVDDDSVVYVFPD